MTRAKKVKRLLLTNDDGFDAPGMAALREVADALADEVWVIAPPEDRSGTGQSVTLNEPLRCHHRGERAFSVSGTPADCVSMGIFHILKEAPPDFVLSGINAGSNIGDETNLSGTLGAAFASIMFGVPSIAISQSFKTRKAIRWDTAKAVTPPLLRHFFETGWPDGVCLSINIPDLPIDAVQGFSWGMQSRKTITGMHIDQRQDHREGVYYWQKFVKALPEAEPNDCAILARGDVCVTALSLARSVDLGLPPLRMPAL